MNIFFFTKMERLVPGGWLDDHILNSYANYLEKTEKKCQVTILSTFLFTKLTECEFGYRYWKVHRWTKRKTLWTQDFIILPIHKNKNHWTVVVIAMRQEKILYYDSWPFQETEKKKHQSFGKLAMEVAARFLRDDILTHGKGNEDVKIPKPSTWEHCVVANPPQQDNSSDCGVFVAEIMKRFCEHNNALTLPSLDFGPQNTPIIRARILKVITS